MKSRLTGPVLLPLRTVSVTALSQAAAEAAYQATFKPRVINGKPIQVDGILVYNFIHQWQVGCEP